MYLIRKVIPLTAIVLSTFAVKAQNLIANPSFEDVNICTEIHAPCNPAAWESVAPESYRIDYMYHAFKTGAGHNLIRLTGTAPTSIRNYAQSQLLCPLEKGRKYRVTILAATDNNTIPLIDVRFDTAWTYRLQGVSLPDQNPDVQMRKENVVKTYPDKQHTFYLLQKEFIARDHLSHIVIGHFEKPEQKEHSIRFLVDSIAIEPSDHRSSLCAEATQIREALYARNHRHTIPLDFYRRLTGDIHHTPVEMDCYTITVKDERIFTIGGRSQQPEEAARLDSMFRLNDGSTKMKVSITGYSYEDNSVNYNLVRSVDKAKRIGEILVYKYGFSFDDISWEGKGNRHPRFDITTPEGREQNNFVDIRFCFPHKIKAAAPPPPAPDTLVIPDVLFKFNSAELNNKLFSSLDSLIERIPRNDSIRLQLVGHTDDAGADAYNMDLSLRRATTVAEYLRQKGLAQYIRHVSGLGETRPVVPNDSKENRQKNRRVDIIIYKGSD